MADEPSYWEKAHIEAHNHLVACVMASLDEPEDDVEDPSCAPFCGCETCIVREVLYAAYDSLEQHFKEQHENPRP